MADRSGWQHAVESELRAAGRVLEVPPAGDLTAAVQQRLERRGIGSLQTRTWRRRPRWRAALVVLAALLAVLIATPQGRAVISHVFRFAGVELRQEPGPVRSPGGSGALPGERLGGLTTGRLAREAGTWQRAAV